jgi:hypothetical protein
MANGQKYPSHSAYAVQFRGPLTMIGGVCGKQRQNKSANSLDGLFFKTSFGQPIGFFNGKRRLYRHFIKKKGTVIYSAELQV